MHRRVELWGAVAKYRMKVAERDPRTVGEVVPHAGWRHTQAI